MGLELTGKMTLIVMLKRGIKLSQAKILPSLQAMLFDLFSGAFFTWELKSLLLLSVESVFVDAVMGIITTASEQETPLVVGITIGSLFHLCISFWLSRWFTYFECFLLWWMTSILAWWLVAVHEQQALE